MVWLNVQGGGRGGVPQRVGQHTCYTGARAGASGHRRSSVDRERTAGALPGHRRQQHDLVAAGAGRLGNTAFIGMAGTLGWPKVRDTALALGFQLRAQPEGAQPLALGRGAETTVGPDTAQGAQIGNDGLGGGGVEGAPLQMAAMIATIANEGRAVQPSLVTAVRRPGSHRTESVTGAQSQRLSLAVTDALRTALTDVASTAAGGTARTLAGRTAASSTSRRAPMSCSSPTRRRLLGCSPDRSRGSSGSSRPPTGVVRRGGGDTRRDRGSARGAGRRPLGHRRRCGGTRRTAQARASCVSDRGWSGRRRVA